MTEHNNPAGTAVDRGTLRAEFANALHDDWCGCDSWDGVNCETFHDSEFPGSADVVLTVVRPVLERQAAEIADHWRAADADEGTKAELAEENIGLLAEVARLTRERDALSQLLRGMAQRASGLREARNAWREADLQDRKNWDGARAANMTALDTIATLERRLASRPAIPAAAVEPGVVEHIRPVKVSADRAEFEVSTRTSDGTTRAYVREWGRKGGCRQVGLILTDEKRAELVARLSAPVSGSDTTTVRLDCGCGHPETPFGADTSWMCDRHRPVSSGGGTDTTVDGGDQ